MRRLVTRSDFDGLVCAMLLNELGIIDEIKFVHPKDVQDGKIELTEDDITTNLPFDKRVGLAFDHHESELIRNKLEDYLGKYIIDKNAKSAARVVYDYYGAEMVYAAQRGVCVHVMNATTPQGAFLELLVLYGMTER